MIAVSLPRPPCRGAGGLMSVSATRSLVGNNLVPGLMERVTEEIVTRDNEHD
jgi:hypothetical protein